MGPDYATGTALDSSGNIYVTGDTQSFCCSNPEAFLLKFNSTGSLLWQRAWPGGSQFGGGIAVDAHGLALDPAGDIYITGYIRLNYTSHAALLLLKFDASGNLLWQKQIGGSQDNVGKGITISPSGSIYVTGSTRSLPFGNQALSILKFNPNGTLLWQTAWTEDQSESGTAIAADAAENLYVTGYTGNMQAGILLKLNSNGDILWQEQVSPTGNTNYGTFIPINALTLDAAGNGYATGLANIYYTNGSSIQGIPILKFTTNGILVWERLLHGGTESSSGNGIAVDSAGEVAVTGQVNTYSNNPPSGILLMQLDSNGTLAWAVTKGIGRDTGSGIAIDANHHLILVGSVNQAPPYPQLALNNQTTTNDLILQYAPGFPVTPNATVVSLNITAVTPAGSLSYAGLDDAYILKTEPPPPTPPSPPSVLVAQGYSNNVTLSWNPPRYNGSRSLTGYQIYRGMNTGAEKPLVNISTSHRYVDMNVRSGNTYYYYVTALNGVGESTASNEGSATVGVRIDPVLLAAPFAGVGALVILFLFLQRRRKYIRISH